MTKKIIYLFFIWFITFPEAIGQKKISVLFVGNSLTYFNDLPELVKAIARCDSIQLTYHSLSFPNYALEDHLNDGRLIKEITTRKYDFVIAQQGPSSQQEGRMMLLRDGLRIAELCAENYTQLAFYTVWPSKARSMDFQGVIESYRLAADSTKSILCPAGQAWLLVWKNYPDFKLYSEDDFHPDYRGSLLAALVIYGSIMQKDDLRFANYNKLKKSNLSKEDFKILIQAAQGTLVGQKP